MVKIVLIEKNGDVVTSNVNTIDESKLYKKCNFRSDKNFSKQTSWNYKNNTSSDLVIHLYAKDDGRANSENKYDLPPPVDEKLYFGKMLLVCYDNENNKYVNFTKENWEAKYEQLFGGFENLDDEEDEEEEEEIPQHLQTKEGYSKEDGFVVDSNDSDDIEYIPSDEKDDSDEESASYGYSDEEQISEEEDDEDSDDESDDDIEEILESDIEDDNSELEEEDYL
ncbi:MAG: hypothetical protein CML42_07470 [Rhodobacteraceae bacterium]|nr:hypothetical protein [Paracoccaceae bacterium]|tara:strand:- start:20200 stop:20871 length:672 start_codon:yes stop_codon:yes gene_type:complete